MSAEPQYEDWLLEDLKPHPLQEVYFTGLDEHGLAELTSDIERNDLREAIDVLPEGNAAGLPKGTIISGHQRRLALLKLGYERTEAYVRYDLADLNADEIEQYLIESNRNRQHLTKLQQARIARRLYEIEQNREPGSLRDWEAEEARDRVGKQIGMSGRNLQRYWNVLDAPHGVQQSFDEGRLPLTIASRVAGLSNEEQDQIAQRIADGEAAKDVVDSFLIKQDGPPPINTLLRRFHTALERSLAEIKPRLKEARSAPPEDAVQLLDDTVAFLELLRKQYQRNRKHADHAMERLLEELE